MNLIDIVLGTPYWVWILFGYLLVVGVRALKPYSVSLWRLSIMPIIFITWSLFTLCNKFIHCLPFVIIMWQIFSLIGSFIGCLLMYRNIFIDKEGLVHVSGSFVPLLLSLIFFSEKYALGLTYAINPIMKESVLLIGIDVFLSAFISGILLGKFLYILKFVYVFNFYKK